MTDLGTAYLAPYLPEKFIATDYSYNWIPQQYGEAFVGPNFKVKPGQPGDTAFFADIVVSEVEPPPSGGTTSKIWNGTEWLAMDATSVWSGTEWVPWSGVKLWDGTEWVAVTGEGGGGNGEPAEPTYADLIISHGPAAYWRFDEPPGSTFAADHSGFGRTGEYYETVILGNPGIPAGGTCLDTPFDGKGAMRIASDFLAGQLPAGITLECWVKWDGSADASQVAYNHLIFNDDEASGSEAARNWRLALGKTCEKIEFLVWADNGVLKINHTATVDQMVVKDGNWHHIVATYDLTTSLIYLDGVTVGNPLSATSLVIDNRGGKYLNVGYSEYYDKGGIVFIDEAAVYGRALTAAEIAEHYAAGLVPA